MSARSNCPKTAIAYLRVSTRDQHLGLEAQKAALEAWAARHGVSIVGWHEDRVSGTTALDGRPGLLAALAAIKAEKAGILLLQKRDRLARDAVEAGLIERAIAKLGAELRTAEGANEAKSATSALVNGILDHVAAFEGATIRARITAALQAKRVKGEKLGGLVPYGQRLSADGVHLEACPIEGAVVADVRALAQAGLSQRAIVAELCTRGVTSRKGTSLGKTQIARMLAA